MDTATTPSAPPWLLGFQNLVREHGFVPLTVEGELPTGLRGTFYRNGAGIFERFGERVAHWFDAEPAVTAVRFDRGSAGGAVRMIRTPGTLREEASGRRLYGGYNTPLARPIRELLLGDSKNPAGTSVFFWQGRLYATCEGGKPVEIDPVTLATTGVRDFDGLVVGGFSAHSHYVPARRAHYNFGLTMGRRTIATFYELPDRGLGKRLVELPLAHRALVHDFAATDRHLVLVVPPMGFRPFDLLFRGRGFMDAMTWSAERGSEVIVVPLDRPTAAWRMVLPAFLLEHTIRAQERDGQIEVTFTRYLDAAARERYLGPLVRGESVAPLGCRVEQMLIDIERRSASFRVVHDEPFELPCAVPGVPQLSVGVAFREPGRATGYFDRVDVLDIDGRGRVASWCPPDGHYPSEPLVVEDAARRLVLTLTLDSARKETYLAVLDLAGMSSGPIAKVWMGQPIPFGFHGRFVPG